MKTTIIIPYAGESLLLKSALHNISQLNVSRYDYETVIVSETPIETESSGVKCLAYKFTTAVQAYNYALDHISTDYVMFLLPGDFLNKEALDSVSFQYDVIQLQHSRVSDPLNSYNPYTKDSFKNKPGVYDLKKSLLGNKALLCDKIFRFSIIKDNNIRFLDSDKSMLMFNLKFMDSASTALVVPYQGVVHTTGQSVGFLSTDRKKLIKEINSFTVSSRRMMKELDIIADEYKDEAYNDSIDFVFPYVNFDDPVWREEYDANKEGNGIWASGEARYRDNGLLRYLFRGIDKHLPWISKVHMIVSSETQVPEWVDRDEVDIIVHKDFMPAEVLPTFNSCTIEMFLPLLPCTANRFIYSNDDVLFFKDRHIDSFFLYGKPMYSMSFRDRQHTQGDYTKMNAYNLIMGQKQNERMVITQHSTLSYRKDWILECYKKYEDEILESCTKFRKKNNFNQYLYAFYQMMRKETVNSKIENATFYMSNKKSVYRLENADLEKFDSVCINDGNAASEDDWKLILKKIDKLLPEKSKYEV